MTALQRNWFGELTQTNTAADVVVEKILYFALDLFLQLACLGRLLKDILSSWCSAMLWQIEIGESVRFLDLTELSILGRWCLAVIFILNL